MVMSSFMPSIWNAPSPIVQITVRSGVGELGRDRVRHRGEHGGQAAREVAHHPASQPDVVAVPVGGRSGVGGDDRLLRQALVELVVHPPRVDAVVVVRPWPARPSRSPTRTISSATLLLPGEVGLLVQQRDQRGQGALHVAPEVQLGRVAEAHLLRLEVDLDGAGLPGRRQELPVRIVGAEQDERVAVPSSGAGSAASRAARAAASGTARRTGTTCLPRSAVMMPAPASLAASSTSSVAPFAPCPTRKVTFSPALMISRRLQQLAVRRNDRRRRRDRARPGHPHLRCRLDHLHALHVVRKDDDGRLQAHACRPEGGVDDGLRLLGRDDGLHVAGDVREDALQVALLLVEGAERVQRPAGRRSRRPAGCPSSRRRGR